MNTLKYFLTFLTGTSIGLIAGYIAGSNKEIVLDSDFFDEISKKKDVLNKAIEKDILELKHNYNSKLDDLTRQIEIRLEKVKNAAKAKE
jgi:hypothetical protein